MVGGRSRTQKNSVIYTLYVVDIVFLLLFIYIHKHKRGKTGEPKWLISNNVDGGTGTFPYHVSNIYMARP